MQHRQMALLLWLAAALLALALLAGSSPVLLLRVRAVPFASVRPARLQLVNNLCVLDASGLGISSISRADIDSYASDPCGAIATLLLSNNSLTSLPSDLFASQRTYIGAIDLSANLLNASGVANFWNRSGVSTAGSCVFCGPSPAQTSVDLSWNPLGPDVPAVFRQLSASSLALLGTGITDVAAGAFAGLALSRLDLSLNDLAAGLHPRSFSGITWRGGSGGLALSNCRLRSSSLPPGVFESNSSSGSGTASMALVLSNIVVVASPSASDTDTIALQARLGLDPLASTRRMFSAELFNPPGQPYAYRTPTLRQFLDSWGNFFDPFPAGLFYTAPVGATYQLLPLASIQIGGQRGNKSRRAELSHLRRGFRRSNQWFELQRAHGALCVCVCVYVALRLCFVRKM